MLTCLIIVDSFILAITSLKFLISPIKDMCEICEICAEEAVRDVWRRLWEMCGGGCGRCVEEAVGDM